MIRTVLAAAAAIPLLMGCALFAHAEDLGRMTPTQMGVINTVCAKVMGLRQGEVYYADCQDSLAHSLARRDAAYGTAAGEESCRGRGLAPGSAALATCMLDAHARGAAPTPQPVTFVSDAVEPGKSYYSVTPSVQFQRKRYACAQLGLTPGSGLFGECVASLEGALQQDF